MIDGRQIFKHFNYIQFWCRQFMYARGTLAPFLRLGEVGRVRALKRVTKHARNVAVLVTKRILIHTVEPPLHNRHRFTKGPYFCRTFHTLTLV